VHAGDSSVVCSHLSGELVTRTGVPLADVYLEFLGGRCRRQSSIQPLYAISTQCDWHGA